MRWNRYRATFLWGAMLSVSATGCHFESRESVVSKQETVDPQIVELRGKYLLTAAPEGVVSIYDAKRSLDDKPQVVLTGRIGAGKHDPWEKGKATFVISDASTDPSGHEKDPNHDKDNCPFCKRRSSPAETTAIVQFVDDKGEVLPVDAQSLLGAHRDQLVVVRGKGEVNGLGTLVVSADGIYVSK